MSGLEDEDDNVVVEKEIPKYRIEFTDMKNEALMLKIIKYAAEAIENSNADNQTATKLKVLLDADQELNLPSNPQNLPDNDEHGVWQVLVGRQFTASVTFDAENLMYFQFSELNKYFMVFRS
jgi:hypothetical protein